MLSLTHYIRICFVLITNVMSIVVTAFKGMVFKLLMSIPLCEDIYKFNASKCVSDFNRQSNMIFANFKHANSYIRNVLLHSFLWQPGNTSNVWRLYVEGLICMENSCAQGVASPLDHTLCTSPTFG